MYLLLIAVHIIFFYIAHMLGSMLMQGAFVLLLIFFLLYFSPLFFSETPQRTIHSHIPDFDISPKQSILIPLILTYLGIYVLAFTVTGDIGSHFHLHIYILLLIFFIFSGYILAFDWQKIFFRDALRFHLICSYLTILAQVIYFFTISREMVWVHVAFSAVTIAFSYFFFTYFRDESVHIFISFLTSFIFTVAIVILYFISDIHVFTLLGSLGILMILMFEYIPKMLLFDVYIEEARLFLLSGLIIISVILLGSSLFSYFSFVYFLPIFSVFLFSIHFRYSNYIAYITGIGILFFLYSYLFYSLLITPVIGSSLIFIFFFPICLIGNTYFWQERYPYDFIMLHYCSIGFSVIASFYSLFFVAWGGALTLFFGCLLFLMALLFLLSYFRFQYQ